MMPQSLILFGAGASSGSDPDQAAVPPLGDKLFDALCAFNPEGWGAVGDNFAKEFRDFEKGMKAFADANPTKVDILQRAMAAYFFAFRPKTTSLYLRLAKWICQKRWNGAVASLNYERLLECGVRARARLDLQLSELLERQPDPIHRHLLA